MAVLDWWEIIRDFIMDNASAPIEVGYSSNVFHSTPYASKACTYVTGSGGVVTKCPPVIDCDTIPFEFKLNITDSEIILVEDTSVLDSNAIILKVVIRRSGLIGLILKCYLMFINFFFFLEHDSHFLSS